LTAQNKRLTGNNTEQAAADYLREKGYRIRETNFRCRQGEIDIVAEDGRCLVFVEVKYRRTAGAGSPLEAVTISKQRKISRIALFYLNKYKLPADQPVRFDVIGLMPEKITHIKNAFDYIS